MTWERITKIASTDTNVFKYVFSNEKAVAEAVLYRYGTFEERTVICCSTMSGCPVGCRFCGAGDYFVKNLTSDEIVSQVTHLMLDNGIDATQVKRMQIMFMSMGEPLLNIDHLGSAMARLSTLYPTAALLISTSAPRVDYRTVRALSQTIPAIGLQFSVHESTDEKRDALIPFKAKLTLAEIAEEGVRWYRATGRQPFFNYCAHAGNSSAEDADRLRALFNPGIWQCTISVVCEREESVAAANERQRQLASDFAGMMLARGYGVRVFNPAGQDDIGGGCGQLWFVQEWMRSHPDRAKPSIGHGRDVVHAPTPA